jgi:hypothetical protein
MRKFRVLLAVESVPFRRGRAAPARDVLTHYNIEPRQSMPDGRH